MKKVETIKTAAEKVVKVLEERNAKYGDKNLLTYGILGLVVRMNDKIARITTAISENSSSNNTKEIIKDALIDIAGYAINGLRLLENGEIDFYGEAFKDYCLIRKDMHV